MKRSIWKKGLALIALLVLLFADFGAAVPTADAAGSPSVSQALIAKSKKKKKKNTPTPRPTKTPAPTPSPTPSPSPASDSVFPTVSPVPDGPIIDPQSIADYLFAHGELPDNFITKAEAKALGWDSSYNYVSDVAPGKSIGGDYFGNYEQLLPVKKGRKYYECDCWYVSGRRNAYRIIYSNDGLVFYTEDHYQTFTEMHPWTETPQGP